MKIDVCFSPALYPVYHNPEAIVVVVDVFRATTTMAAAFKHGVRSIRPVATVEEAQEYKAKGWLVGAERNVKRCDFADFGNSPFDYTPEKVAGKDVIFTTTNGTRAITIAKSAYRVITGAFVNLQAVADYCLFHGRDVVVLCSGWQDKVNIEDTLFGGALVEVLAKTGKYRPATDAAVIARDMWTNEANGFSHNTCLPCFMQRILCGACKKLGEAIYTASINELCAISSTLISLRPTIWLA